MAVNVHGRAPQRLLAASPAMPRESRFSWIQRLCGDHQYSLARLGIVAGIKPVSKDWDTGVSDAQWTKLLKLADVQPDTCGEASQSLDSLSGRLPVRRFLLYKKQSPVYRWCSLCMASDTAPYLRWEWRLIGVTHCSIHRVQLHDRCSWCGSSLQLDKTLLVPNGLYGGAPNLATCGCCGMSLCDRTGEADTENRIDTSLEASQVLIEELLDRLRQAHQSHTRQLKLDFSRYAYVLQPDPCSKVSDVAPRDSPMELPWIKSSVKGLTRARRPSASNMASPGTPPELPTLEMITMFLDRARRSKVARAELSEKYPKFSWAETRIERLPPTQSPTLLLTGAVFRDGFTLPLDVDAGVKKWSRLLRPEDRARLAAALRSIRREKNLMKHERNPHHDDATYRSSRYVPG